MTIGYKQLFALVLLVMLGFDLELFDDSVLHPRARTKYPLLHLTIGDPDSGDTLQFEKD